MREITPDIFIGACFIFIIISPLPVVLIVIGKIPASVSIVNCVRSPNNPFVF